MEIRCEKCNTVYSLDESLLSPSGTPVRCTSCNNVFNAFPQTPQSAAKASPVAAGYPGNHKERDRFPTIRTKRISSDGNEPIPGARSTGSFARTLSRPPIRTVGSERNTEPPPPIQRPDKTQPQPKTAAVFPKNDAPRDSLIQGQTIRATAATPPDSGPANAPPAIVQTPPLVEGQTIRQTGSPSQSQETPSRAPVSYQEHFETGKTLQANAIPSNAGSAATGPKASPHDPDLSEIPAVSQEDWVEGTSIREKEPAWTETSTGIPTSLDDFDNESHTRNGHAGKWVALLAIMLLAGAGAYVYLFMPQLLVNPFGKVLTDKDQKRLEAFFIKGQEHFLLDTETEFVQADRQFHQVLALQENHGPTLSALARMYAVWAQYLRDRELDARADASLVSEKTGAPLDIQRADEIHREFRTRLSEAHRWAEMAIDATPDSQEAHLVMSDIQRLMGDADRSARYRKQGRTPEAAPEVAYLDALAAIDQGHDPAEVVGMLTVSISSQPLLRALYRKARVQGAMGDADAARASLAEIFRLNSDHTEARTLLERLNSGAPIPLAPAAPAASGDTDTLTSSDDTSSADEARLPATAAAPTEDDDDEKDDSNSVDRMLERASRLQENGRTLEAMNIFNDILKKEPRNVDALSGVAYCHLDRKSVGQAIAHFRRALEVNGGFGPAIIGMAQTYKTQNQKQEALNWYTRYLETNPTGRHAGTARRNIDQLKSELAKTEEPAPEDTEKTVSLPEQPTSKETVGQPETPPDTGADPYGPAPTNEIKADPTPAPEPGNTPAPPADPPATE